MVGAGRDRPERFARSTIKRHEPLTNRKSRLDGYHGCLCVNVRQGRVLHEVIEGLVTGLATAPRAA